jgi:hypothetical protein
MEKLRPTTKKKIFNLLESSRFSSFNFEVDFDKEDYVAKITYVINPSFYIILIKRAHSYNKKYTALEAPGENFLEEESYELENFKDVFERIPKWIERIYQDYIDSQPIFDEINEIRNSFEEKFKQYENKQEYFNLAEIDEMKSKLDSLVSEIEKLNKLNNQNEIELGSLKQEIVKIKEDLSKLPKGVWFRMAGQKIITFIGKIYNTELGKQIINNSVKLLLPKELTK